MSNGIGSMGTFNRSFKMSRTNTSYNQKKDPYSASNVQGPPREIGVPTFRLGEPIKIKPYDVQGVVTKINMSPGGFKYLVKTNTNETFWTTKNKLVRL